MTPNIEPNMFFIFYHYKIWI